MRLLDLRTVIRPAESRPGFAEFREKVAALSDPESASFPFNDIRSVSSSVVSFDLLSDKTVTLSLPLTNYSWVVSDVSVSNESALLNLVSQWCEQPDRCFAADNPKALTKGVQVFHELDGGLPKATCYHIAVRLLKRLSPDSRKVVLGCLSAIAENTEALFKEFGAHLPNPKTEAA